MVSGIFVRIVGISTGPKLSDSTPKDFRFLTFISTASYKSRSLFTFEASLAGCKFNKASKNVAINSYLSPNLVSNRFSASL